MGHMQVCHRPGLQQTKPKEADIQYPQALTTLVCRTATSGSLEHQLPPWLLPDTGRGGQNCGITHQSRVAHTLLRVARWLLRGSTGLTRPPPRLQCAAAYGNPKPAKWTGKVGGAAFRGGSGGGGARGHLRCLPVAHVCRHDGDRLPVTLLLHCLYVEGAGSEGYGLWEGVAIVGVGRRRVGFPGSEQKNKEGEWKGEGASRSSSPWVVVCGVDWGWPTLDAGRRLPRP